MYKDLIIRPQDVKRGKLFPEDYISEVVAIKERTGKRLPMGEYYLEGKLYAKEVHGSGGKYKNAIGGIDLILLPFLEAIGCKVVGVHFKGTNESFFSRFEAVKLAGYETLGNSFFRWGRWWLPLDVCGTMKLPSKYTVNQEQPQEDPRDRQVLLFEEDALMARMRFEQ
jgi:hypothetical protein